MNDYGKYFTLIANVFFYKRMNTGDKGDGEKLKNKLKFLLLMFTFSPVVAHLTSPILFMPSGI